MASLSLAEPGRPLVYQDTCLRISRIPRYSPLYRICRRAWRSIISRISSAPGRGRSFPVRSYSRRSEKIQGFPWAPRPIITPSQPVSSIMARADAPETTSPFPITGMDTASFTWRIMSQSAFPE